MNNDYFSKNPEYDKDLKYAKEFKDNENKLKNTTEYENLMNTKKSEFHNKITSENKPNLNENKNKLVEFFESTIIICLQYIEINYVNFYLKHLEFNLILAKFFKMIDSKKLLLYLENCDSLITSIEKKKLVNNLENESSFKTLKEKVFYLYGCELINNKEYCKGIFRLKQAYEMYCKDNNTKKRADCLIAIGFGYENLGDLNSSLGFFQNALVLREEKYGINTKEYQIILNKVNRISLNYK